MGSEARARLGLAALLAMTLFSFEQLFQGADYVGPTLLGMLIAAGIAIGARRVGLGTFLTLVASAAGLVVYLSLVFRTPKTFYGLPTADAISGLVQAVERALTWSAIDFAPVPQRPGYVILTIIGMWSATTIGELATFRWRRPVVAVVGPVALFAMLMIVGTGMAAQAFMVAFVTALLAYWALESAHRLRSWGRWVAAWKGSAPQPQIGARLARRMGASCLAAALVSPVVLPAIEQSLVSWRSGSGGGGGGEGSGGQEIDLLVSIKPKLVDQSSLEMFRVTADAPSYWRLASLGEFDGTDWERVRSLDPIEPDADTDLTQFTSTDIAFPGADNFERIEQEFFVQELVGREMPGAVQADSVSVPAFGDRRQEHVRVHPETGELSITEGLIKFMRYDVTSMVPVVSRPELRTAAIGEADPEYTEVGEVSDRIHRLLDRWTRGAETDYEKLVAIQDELRGFTYSTELGDDADASADYLETFLLDTRRGYCQQFATAFAVLARTLGYPTRVSVGFLPGSASPDRPNEYVVRGTDAHAWPEVLFADYGWVRFEPTPRAQSIAPSYTVPNADVLPPDAAGRGGANPSNLPPGLRDVRINARDPRSGGLRGGDPGADEGAGQTANAVATAWKRTFSALMGAVALASLVFLFGVPLLKEWRIRRRYLRARGPVGIALAAFAQFQDDAGALVSVRDPAESAAAYARRLVTGFGVPRSSVVRLANLYEAAEYAPGGISPEQAAEAKRLAGTLRGRLWTIASWWQRLTRVFSPRGLRA